MQPVADHELAPWLIVEDDATMRHRLSRLLADAFGGHPQIAFAGSIAEAKTRIVEHAAGFSMVDIGLPDGSGIDLIAWLHIHHAQTATVVISAWGDEETVLAALQAGAIGYLLKERDDVELKLALQSIHRGGAPIDPFVARRILALLSGTRPTTNAADPAHASPSDTLSGREVEVLHLVARGLSNREIARLTKLSRFTIEDYTKSIYRKLAVNSRTAAVFEARALGLLH